MNILQFLIDIKSKDNGVLGQVSRLQSRLDDTDRSATRLANTVGVKLKTAFMSLPGADFFTNPIVALTAGIGLVSKMGMEAEKTAAAYEVLTGSAEAGSKLLGELNQYARDTIYDGTGVQNAAQTMVGFGVATKDVMNDLRMIGDVAMGDKNKMSALALVFGQVAAAGKLQGQDLLQLINAGYNPLLDMSAMTGKSVAQLKDEMSKGNITFEMLRGAFQRATSEGGKFYQMTDKIAKTPYGVYQQTLGKVTEKLLEMYKVVQPLLVPAFGLFSMLLDMASPVIQTVAEGVNWIVELFKEWNPLIIGLTASIAAYSAVGAVNTFVLKGWTLAEWLHVTALIAAEKAQKLLNLAILKSPVGWIALGIGALVAALVYCWQKFAGFRAFILTVWDTLSGFGSMIKDAIIDRFRELVEGIGSVGKALIHLVKGDFSAAWEEASNGARKLAGVDSARKLVGNARNLANQTAQSWEKHLKVQRDKDTATSSLSAPQAAGGITGTGTSLTQPSSTASSNGTANSIVAGGTRNTQISINITKFFDYINVTMMDKADSSEIQRVVVEAMTRALETATSSNR